MTGINNFANCAGCGLHHITSFRLQGKVKESVKARQVQVKGVPLAFGVTASISRRVSRPIGIGGCSFVGYVCRENKIGLECQVPISSAERPFV